MKRTRTRIRPKPDFGSTILKTGMSFAQLQRTSGVSKSTIFAVQNPSIHYTRTAGTVHEATAWKLANAYASHTHIPPDAAFDLLFVREEEQPEQAAAQE